MVIVVGDSLGFVEMEDYCFVVEIVMWLIEIDFDMMLDDILCLFDVFCEFDDIVY